MLVARKMFTFQSKPYVQGDVIPEDLLSKYQRETYLRAGFITEKDEPKRKADMVEVKPLPKDDKIGV